MSSGPFNSTRKKADPESILRNKPALEKKLKKLFMDIMEEAAGEPSIDEAVPGHPDIITEKNQVIGDFRIIREIGAGGMAKVYEAEQISLGRRVALKILPSYLTLSKKATQRFKREAEAGSRQQHPGIVTIYEMGECNGVQYIAQELIKDGHTLAQGLEKFKKSRDLPPVYYYKAAKVIADVADALDHAHDSGVIHSDIKPGNILLTQKGWPKVADFGFARVENTLFLSQSGEFSGTPFYMSPEQAEGRRKELDARTDVFSLGVTLYELLTLDRPFDGKTSQEITRKIISEEPKDPRKANQDVPLDLSTICIKAMEKAPEHRYQSMKEFSGDLKHFMKNEPIAAKPCGIIRKTWKYVRRHRLLTIAALSSLSAAAILLVLLAYISSQHDKVLKLIREQFLPVKEAFNWPDLSIFGNPWEWCTKADPDDPSGYILRSIDLIEASDLGEALTLLDDCIPRCRLRNETCLEKDALYLRALVKHRIMHGKIVHQRTKTDLIKEAEFDLSQAGSFDPVSMDAFLWHHNGKPCSETEDDKWCLKPLLLNSDHYLVHLYQGVYLFQALFLGGKKMEFESAIQHLEAVIERQPRSVVALTLLGRVQYFYARFYNYLGMLDEACNNLNTALKYAGNDPYTLIETTLGQIWLLRGDKYKAYEYFKKILERKKHPSSKHNILKGMGEVYAFFNRFEQAKQMYEEALDLLSEDPHVNVAFAELCFREGDFAKARNHTNRAKMRTEGKVRVETKLASAYLMSARLYMAKGDFEKALEDFQQISAISIQSPKDLSLACLLIASMPKEHITSEAGAIAELLANDAVLLACDSAISNSAAASAFFLKGKHGDSLANIDKAINIREHWPPDIKMHRWAENARDMYLLALAHHGIASTLDAGQEKSNQENMAAEQLKKAEELYLENSDKGSPVTYPEIIEGFRNKALKALQSR